MDAISDQRPFAATPLRSVAPASCPTEPKDVFERLDDVGVHAWRPRRFTLSGLLPPYVRMQPEQAQSQLRESAVLIGRAGETPYPLGPLDGIADLRAVEAIDLGVGTAGTPVVAETLRALLTQGFEFSRQIVGSGDWHGVDPFGLYDFAGNDRWPYHANSTAHTEAVRIRWKGRDVLNTRFGFEVGKMCTTLAERVSPSTLQSVTEAGFRLSVTDHPYEPWPGDPLGHSKFVSLFRGQLQSDGSYGLVFPVPVNELGVAGAIESREAAAKKLLDDHRSAIQETSVRSGGQITDLLGICLYGSPWTGLTPDQTATRLLDFVRAEERATPRKAWPDHGLMARVRRTLCDLTALYADPAPVAPTRIHGVLRLFPSQYPPHPPPPVGSKTHAALKERVEHDWLAVTALPGPVASTRDMRSDALGALGYLYGTVRKRARDLDEFDALRTSFLKVLAALGYPSWQTGKVFEAIVSLGFEADSMLAHVAQVSGELDPDLVADTVAHLAYAVLPSISDPQSRAQVTDATWRLLAAGVSSSNVDALIYQAVKQPGPVDLLINGYVSGHALNLAWGGLHHAGGRVEQNPDHVVIGGIKVARRVG